MYQKSMKIPWNWVIIAIPIIFEFPANRPKKSLAHRLTLSLQLFISQFPHNSQKPNSVSESKIPDLTFQLAPANNSHINHITNQSNPSQLETQFISHYFLPFHPNRHKSPATLKPNTTHSRLTQFISQSPHRFTQAHTDSHRLTQRQTFHHFWKQSGYQKAHKNHYSVPT